MNTVSDNVCDSTVVLMHVRWERETFTAAAVCNLILRTSMMLGGPLSCWKKLRLLYPNDTTSSTFMRYLYRILEWISLCDFTVRCDQYVR